MLSCQETGRLIELYLDGELDNIETVRVELHLDECPACREQIAKEQSWRAALREKAPLYQTPESLRESIEHLTLAETRDRKSSPAPASLHRRIRRVVYQQLVINYLRRSLPIAAALALIIFAAAAFFWLRSGSLPGRSSEFALMAVDSHLRLQQGKLTLELRSDSPQAITDWFAGKLSFNLKLPNYQTAPDHPKPYNLEGARMVGFKNDYAAYISYRMQNRPISLLVTSAMVAHSSGGETINSRGIDFHFETINGLKIITWTDNGLTYALVSDLAERGQASCVVCHQDNQQQLTVPFKSF